MTDRRANYALVTFMEHLGEMESQLDVEWAEFVGDRTTELTFEVSTDDPSDAYLQLQAYDVGTYGHDVLLNGQSLSGFDIPPSQGWQSWMDAITGAALQGGENTLQFVRETDSNDSFVVGNVVVNWREPTGSGV
ncbi:hypothetical protein ACFQE8_10710 [Salinirubellus sp. GCM10025818]|jgi:hypothetical protein|uniref:DUF7383 domain-containing protein n=1 Tax=Salinirubellus TaxID=2162630 RepID=UPI0030D3070E